MRITRLALENFKCYADAELRLDRGVTVVHGLNGSGKSSLLEAAFFALYGARALDETLDEVVSIGTDETTVELWFTHGGGEYHVRRRVRKRDDAASTAECVLETPEGTFEGARDVRGRIAELLRMDSDAFVNCAYVRQGEVNKLINASPGDRQDVIDDLLQLGKLEAYRERASDARVGVGRVRDDKRGALSQVEEQIERKEDRDLHARLNDLESELGDVEAEIEHIEGQVEQADATREQAASVLAEHEEKREELAALEADIEDLREAIASTESEREDLGERLAERREDLRDLRGELADALAETDLSAESADKLDPGDVEARIEALTDEREERQAEIEEHRVEAKEHDGEAESLRERAADLEERAEANRREADEREADLEADRETQAERRDRLDELDDRIEELEAELADAPVDAEGIEAHRESVAEELTEVREEIAETRSRLESQRERVQEAERLLEAGKCPECGQPVDGSPHVDSIGDDRERVDELEAELSTLTDRRETLSERLERAESLVETADELSDLRSERDSLEQLLAERAEAFADREADIESLRAEAEELEAEAETRREEAATAAERAEECRSAVGEINARKQELRAAIERLERVQNLQGAVADAESDIETIRERRQQAGELNDERRERLTEKRERREDLRDAVDEDRVEDAQAEKERAEQYLERAESELSDLRERRDDRQGEIGAVRNEIDELEALRERRDDLAAAVDRLSSLYEEAERLEETYATLRSELRRRNVETLERMLNETFDLIYQNDSYSHIELDGEYRLTVFQKDGEPLDPTQLSGGERALFNLSLRCAIYRLLSEGIEGTAPMPPLILDEPTVFLDSGHVSQLLDLIEYMRDEVGVEQIVVVSHDEELVGAADDLVRVRKDATTNRSTVVRERREERFLEAAADGD